MRYEPRPGIVLTKLCGMRVLIPSRAASAYCTTIRPLPMLWAAVWELLGQEDADEKIMRLYRILTKKPDQKIREELDQLLGSLYEQGFLIEKEEQGTEPPKEQDEG